MSGAFGELTKITKKRMADHDIGFGAKIKDPRGDIEFLKHVKSEDLIEFGFESEFVGRLPVRAVFEKLTQKDLFDILKNPSNPIILGKKLDFAAYDIDIKFEDTALRKLAQSAFNENTGARGLVSAVERALLPFERKLPSIQINKFPVTEQVVENPEQAIKALSMASTLERFEETFQELSDQEKDFIKGYLRTNKKNLEHKYGLSMTPSRIDVIAAYYCNHIMDIEKVIKKIKTFYDDIKKMEMNFYKSYDINIVMEDDAVDFIIEQLEKSPATMEDFYQRLIAGFEYGLKLVREKTGRNRFFITKDALLTPERFIGNLIKDEMIT
jgi:hypothetical protein